MTKKMRLMALGVSIALFTGCSAVDDLIEKYAGDDAEDTYEEYASNTITPAEVASRIIGTWDSGCGQEDGGTRSEWEILTFNADGTASMEQREYDAPGCNPANEVEHKIESFSYVIGEVTKDALNGDAVELDISGERDYYTMVGFTDDFLYIADDNGFSAETPETRANNFNGDFWIRSNENAESPIEHTIAITEAILIGKTFYTKDTDESGVGYGTMLFTSIEGTRHEIWYNIDGTVRSEDTFSFPIALIDGKIRIDVSEFDEGYMWFTLAAEDSNTWDMIKENDLDMDGTDGIETKHEEWFLSKPANFPVEI